MAEVIDGSGLVADSGETGDDWLTGQLLRHWDEAVDDLAACPTDTLEGAQAKAKAAATVIALEHRLAGTEGPSGFYVRRLETLMLATLSGLEGGSPALPVIHEQMPDPELHPDFRPGAWVGFRPHGRSGTTPERQGTVVNAYRSRKGLRLRIKVASGAILSVLPLHVRLLASDQ